MTTQKASLFVSVAALLLTGGSVAAGGVFQTAEAIDLSTGQLTAGGATLTREGNGIHLRAALVGLDPNSVYSVWWIIWNRADQCTTPNPFGGVCLPPPDGADPPDGVRNAAGFTTGADGTANFSAWLASGTPPDGLPFFGKLKNGLTDEVHIVVQSHGAPVAGDTGGQMSIAGFMCGPPADCTAPDQIAFVFPPAALDDDSEGD